jgi:hypothetical protein
MGTIEGAALASIMEWDRPSVWSIKWDMTLLSTLYSVRLFFVYTKLILYDKVIQPNY